ncbi:hypothetical protein ACFS6H_12125 [Terrimonas rubra]|uniref:Uncharacterized protein n=1 Tax=Terrimonas rubra TaxID=1035890 RepID=A0ABW6A550_9BACT
MTKIERAAVYKFKKKNKFLIHGVSSLKTGGGIASEPFIWLDDSAPFSRIVEDLMFALSKTQTGLPMPGSWSEFTKEFLKKIGLKRQRDLSKDSLRVSVLNINGLLNFIPMKNLGNGGFENVSGDKIIISEKETVEQIFFSLEQAFAQSE